MKRKKTAYNRKTVDKRDVNLLLICLTITSLVSIRYVLQNMAAKATEILSPLPDNYTIILEKDPIIIEVPTPTIPEQVEEMIEMVFKDDAPLMLKVARCESGLNPKARNPHSTATGVFQIMASIHGISRTRLENPMVNILVAKELFDASGTNPWLASVSCWGGK